MTARLRPMAAADLHAVSELEHQLFPDDAWSWEMFASELDGRPSSRYYLVAEADGQVVGYAGLLAPLPRPGWRARKPPGGQADVLTMAVATSHWGQGIGSALLTALLAEAACRGCTEVFLEVRADNPRAQRLYRRHGFSACGLRRGYYQPSGVDAVVMCCPLGQAQAAAASGAPRGRRP